MNHVESLLSHLIRPDRLWSRSECLLHPSPVPASCGFYGWYFSELPAGVDGSGCVHRLGCTLLYVGIAPSRPVGHNGLPSKQSLRNRIHMHYAGNAEGSTLRRSLGVLLRTKLKLQADLTRKSKSFGEGEARLSDWMERNAYVAWIEYPEPWAVEKRVIESLDLPLNLAHNRAHPFWMNLTEARSRRRTVP